MKRLWLLKAARQLLQYAKQTKNRSLQNYATGQVKKWSVATSCGNQ